MPEEATALFDAFQGRGNDSLELARHEAIRFCLAMASRSLPARWLSLLGPPATGKTMLARIITRFFRQRMDGFDGLFDEQQSSDTRKFLRHGGFKAWSVVMDEMLNGDFSGVRNLKDDWFVCLDDIGAEYKGNQELSVSKLYEIMNCRLGKFTVITANLTLQEVNRKLDARIASRLIREGNIVVDIEAPDYNL